MIIILIKYLTIIILCGIAGWAIYCGARKIDWEETHRVIMPTEEGWMEVLEGLKEIRARVEVIEKSQR